MSAPLLSAKLVELRQQFGYSQQEVADYLGLTREGYSHYERNAREPNLEIVVKLCELYQIDINELVNTTTVLTGIPKNKSLLPSVGGGLLGDSAQMVHLASKLETISQKDKNQKIISNMNHLLKILTGKNSKLDLTNIDKEDITVLAQYKQLDKQSQKEVRQFIKFKKTLSKNK